MTTTWFRVQAADRDATELLNPENWISRSWSDEELVQDGVSVCGSREDLAAYLAGSGIPLGADHWVLVELTGRRLYTQAHDAHLGEVLVEPDAIVAVTEIDDAMWDLIGAACDAMTD